MNVLTELKKLLAAQLIDLSEQLEIGISISFACKVSGCKGFPDFVKEAISFFIMLSEMFDRLWEELLDCANAKIVALQEIVRQRIYLINFLSIVKNINV